MNYCQFRNDVIKRMAHAGGATPILPPEYQQVEWLQSTGTQYINTGITITSRYERLEMKLTVDSYDTRSRYNGTWASHGSSLFIFSNYSRGPLDCIYIAGSRNDYGATTTTGTAYTIDLTANNGIMSGVCCGYNVNFAYSGSQISGYPETLFAQTVDGVASNFSNAKIYYYRLHTSNGLARDFIPCYRKSDNKPGMYDLVTQSFFTKAGSGEFSIGNPV